MDKQIEKFEFRVIDNNTGEEADIEEIALKEDWAKGLIYCDMEGFAILEDGSLVLLDECGNCAYCPSGRFSIIPEGVVLTREEYSDYLVMKDAHQNAIERCEKLQADNERLYKNIGKFKDAVRKETAEKIADWLDNEKGYCGLGYLVKQKFCAEEK